MLVVVPVSEHDRGLIEDFCNIVNYLGPYLKHDVLIVVRPSDVGFAQNLKSKLFGWRSIKLHVFNENGEKGWPQGPNFYWSRTIQYLDSKSNRLPWFWMELDTTPIDCGWLDDLECEYMNSGKPFLGMVQPSPPRELKRGEGGKGVTSAYKHVVGVAVYPPDMALYNTWKQAERVPLAFDVLCEREIIPKARASKIMQNCFRTEEYRCTNEGLKGIDKQHRASGARYDFLISRNVKIVHGCNDGSLARLILGER